ncbi:MAG: hypothetical protein Q4F41_13230 [Eubacteriales bacterium]|nr:hypothetical protein [Eubacteriales bacterium]
MNAKDMMKGAGMWSAFKMRHPKFPRFLKAVSEPGVITEGTVLELKVTTADGRTMETNLKVSEKDLELIEFARNVNP